jgi:hypothetical protein
MNDDLRGLAAREQPSPVATGSRPVWDEVIARYIDDNDRIIEDDQQCWTELQISVLALIDKIAKALNPESPDFVRRIVSDMRARDAMGRERYGVPLTADNGRNHLVDAYQEALDLLVYLVAHEMAQEAGHD